MWGLDGMLLQFSTSQTLSMDVIRWLVDRARPDGGVPSVEGRPRGLRSVVSLFEVVVWGLPTESECLDLFKDKGPNAGLNPRYSFCKHWLSRKKYLEEAQKRYGKSYGHFSFVPRKLFGKRYSDASGDTKIPGGHVGVQVEIPRDGVDAENQAGSPKVQVASLLSPPRHQRLFCLLRPRPRLHRLPLQSGDHRSGRSWVGPVTRWLWG